MRALAWLGVGLAFGLPATAAPKPKLAPREPSLLAGRDNPSNYSEVAEVVTLKEIVFFKGNKEVLRLKGPAAEKWRQYYHQLGPCFAKRPSSAVKSRTGKEGTIQRFAGGIIVTYDGKSFAMDWEMVQAWEKAGSYKGKLGFPTSDGVSLNGVPPRYERPPM